MNAFGGMNPWSGVGRSCFCNLIISGAEAQRAEARCPMSEDGRRKGKGKGKVFVSFTRLRARSSSG
jgi:hypothetical protein